MTILTSTPALGPLYAKAALTGPLHRGGDTLPDSRYALRDQTLDLDHLAAYQQVCGYRTSDVLPPTYLHVLAFPVAIALMTERGFPFPLIGMVHVANRITAERAVRADETVSFAVRAGELRPHPAGQQFDVLVDASVATEQVWTSRSTYLHRGGGTDEKRDRTDLPEPSAPRAQLRVPGDIGRRYAAVSGDRNPIHLHRLAARAFGFRSAIAHGMWLEARALATLEGRLPDALTVDVAFKTPLFIPATISVSTERTPDGWSLDVRDARSGKPHLAGAITG
jgi:hypothetical protein